MAGESGSLPAKNCRTCATVLVNIFGRDSGATTMLQLELITKMKGEMGTSDEGCDDVYASEWDRRMGWVSPTSLLN